MAYDVIYSMLNLTEKLAFFNKQFSGLISSLIELRNNHQKHQIKEQTFLYLLTYIFLWGRRPYPFCHAKRQSDVLDEWVKIYLSWRFVWQSGSKENLFQKKKIFNNKNIINRCKKWQPICVCFLLHHGTCTQRVFKFYLRNQSTEKGSHLTLL